MGVFEQFPYVNFHELNLSWIINKLKELEDIIGTQIVDVVARAGVAANTQAIQNLSQTVTQNATTAHNESQAAANAASAAQNTADGAVTSITNIDTVVLKDNAVIGDPIQTNVDISAEGIKYFDWEGIQAPAVPGYTFMDWIFKTSTYRFFVMGIAGGTRLFYYVDTPQTGSVGLVLAYPIYERD